MVRIDAAHTPIVMILTFEGGGGAAGDSAQCISKDSTFRFANLKALFFNHFSASRFTRIDPSAAKPELFSLSHNFRSHQGILSLASFVMELLWKGELTLDLFSGIMLMSYV